MDSTRQTTLIATLGGQPQVVTFALDALLSRGVLITQVIVLHFNSNASKHQILFRNCWLNLKIITIKIKI